MADFNITFEELNSTFGMQFEYSVPSYPSYTGPYTVTPLVNGNLVLQTDDKLMTENLTVLKVPQYEVSNPSGGLTLTIGDDY